MLRKTLFAIALLGTLAACGKKPDAAADQTAATTPAAAAAAESAAPPAPAPIDDPALAEKQGKLDYATMEDGYLNDAKGQWATSAKASSSFGDAGKQPPESNDSNTPWQATGAPNGNEWTNDHQDIGFDTIELDYDRPVKATGVRVVSAENETVESISKIELVDVDGQAHTVWSGLSDVKQDARGRRTWFTRAFAPADYQTKTVKVTFANNVASGYKTVDAVQLVGE